MRYMVTALRALIFFFLGVTLWVAGTIFHGFLWWTLGIPEMPAFLPLMNLAFLPFSFWLSWELVLFPRGLLCERCRTLPTGESLHPDWAN